MNKRRLATLISAASVVVLSSTLFGSTLASWAVTDNASEKNIKISTQSTLRTLTFYTTYDGSSWGTPVQRTVFDGDKIAVGDIPAATYSSTDYIFNGWVTAVPTSSNYSSAVNNSTLANTTISDNNSYYPVIESKTDFAYANSTYYELNHDYELSVSSVASVSVGKKYLGIAGIPNATATKSTQNLITASGIYQFHDTGDIFRKIGFYPNTSWRGLWDSTYPSFSFHTWGTYGDYDYLRPNDIENYRYVAYIPATNDNFKIIRQSPSASSIDYDNNHSADMKLSDTYGGSTSYSKTTWILGQYNDVGWNNDWTKSSAWWGDENIS